MTELVPSAFPIRPAISQTGRLVEKLRHYQRGDFPLETQQLAKLFEALGRFAEEQLTELATIENLSAPNRGRVRRLSEAVQNLFSCLRYFESTETRRTPPSIQTLLSALAARHVPQSSRAPIVLVRPQWEYNFEFYYLSEVLRRLIIPEIFDPNDDLKLFSDDAYLDDALYADRFLDAVWDKFALTGENVSRPGEMAVLSFAGLDTDDVLLFPILAHELGHFIDYNAELPQHKTGALAKHFSISFAELEAKLPPDHYSQAEVERFLQILLELIDIAFREIVADLLAIRMMGLGFFLALADLLDRLLERNALQVTDTGYLEIGYRIEIAHQELERIGVISFLTQSEHLSPDSAPIATTVLERLGSWGKWSKSRSRKPLSHDEFPQNTLRLGDWPQKLNELAAEVVERALPELQDLAATLVPDGDVAILDQSFYERVLAIRDELPPTRAGDTNENFSEIMSAAWAHEILPREGSSQVDSEVKARLVLKAMELAAGAKSLANRGITDHPSDSATEITSAGVLAQTEILERVNRSRGRSGRLVILPFEHDAVQGASLDVRLGNWFKISRRPRVPVLDLQSPKSVLTDQVGYEELFLPFGKQLTIHPGDFLLAITLEFFSLPNDLMAFVEGRSLMGRLGLAVATATTVAPGFKGGIVLELSNTGVVPLQLTPGLEIAQVVFVNLTSDAPPYRGSSQCQIRP
jgi:dCTP deaminase